MLHHTTPKETYEQLGYIIYNDLIDEDLLNEVTRATKAGGDNLDKWKWLDDKSIVQLAYHESILDVLRELYGQEPFPFQTLNFNESPSIGLHADTIHFNTDPPGWMCGVWIALEDATMDNGPLQYFPESHKRSIVTFEKLGLTPVKQREKFHQNLGVYSGWLAERNRRLGLEPETLICKRGTVLVWHANLMHKSIKAKPGTTRASQVTHYYFRVPGIKYTVPAFGVDHKKVDAFALENHARPGLVL